MIYNKIDLIIVGVSFSSAFFGGDGYLRFPIGNIPLSR